MLERVDYEKIKPLEGEEFSYAIYQYESAEQAESIASESNGIKLVEVEDLSIRLGKKPDNSTPFSLLFTGGGDTLIQSMYKLNHQSIGEFIAFVVPVVVANPGAYNAKQGDCFYEAIFN